MKRLLFVALVALLAACAAPHDKLPLPYTRSTHPAPARIAQAPSTSGSACADLYAAAYASSHTVAGVTACLSSHELRVWAGSGVKTDSDFVHVQKLWGFKSERFEARMHDGSYLFHLTGSHGEGYLFIFIGPDGKVSTDFLIGPYVLED